MSAPVVWFVALPHPPHLSHDNASADDANKACHDLLASAMRTAFTNYSAPTPRFAQLDTPPLRAGSLDALLGAADASASAVALCSGVLARLRRAHAELSKAANPNQGTDASSTASYAYNAAAAEPPSPNVNGMTAEEFIMQFKWDTASMPARKTLADLISITTKRATDLDEQLRQHAAEATSKRADAAALGKKFTGPLATRDLNAVIEEDHVLETEHISTLFANITQSNKQAWLAGYERWAQGFVVPRSSRCVASDATGEIWSVHLFRRVKDAFVTSAREAGIVVREHPSSAALAEAALAAAHGQAADGDDGGTSTSSAGPPAPSTPTPSGVTEAITSARAMASDTAKRAAAWAESAHAEVLALATHVAMVRCFAEGCLRYGIPPRFSICCVRARPAATTTARAALLSAFTRCGGSPMRHCGLHSDGADDADESPVAGVGAADVHEYPYVNVSLSL